MSKRKKQTSLQGPRWSSVLAMASAGVVASALPAMAQDASSFEATGTPPPLGEYRVSLGAGYRTEADLDDRVGNFSELAMRASAAAKFNVSERFSLGPVFSYQWSHYDINDIGSDTQPWEDVHILRATALFNYKIDEKWSVYGGPSGSISAEDSAEWGDAMSGGVLAGFNYNHSETLSVGAGLGVFSRLKDDMGVMPIITANWRFAESWTLRAGFMEVGGNGGLGADVMYDFAPNWKVGGGIMFQQKRFLTDENGPMEGSVVQDRSMPIFAKVGWQPSEKITLEAVAGVVVGGELKITDDAGNDLGDNDYETSAVFGLRAIFRF